MPLEELDLIKEIKKEEADNIYQLLSRYDSTSYFDLIQDCKYLQPNNEVETMRLSNSTNAMIHL
ncbi:hypothetical protein [uncultured Parabacteroides sp.]|jgi:hypothetical protein|uniref:hypothetical protein n=1 Tax=uncultured Parabacteroides sp. TaxID=512312 RepID=UPI0025F09B8D|nr:hypothetical protein [uncultured Parabacteroides sp.]